METDRDDSQVLSREQCLALVASVPIGRVVYTERALPAITPTNFVLDGEEIVIRTGSGSTLAVAVRGAVVAFQVDDFDLAAMTGWSVTITGQARFVDRTEGAARLTRPSLPPWAGAANHQLIVIPARQVSGCRLGRAGCVLAPGEVVRQDQVS